MVQNTSLLLTPTDPQIDVQKADFFGSGTSCGRRGEQIVCALEFCSCAKDFPFRVPLSPIASYPGDLVLVLPGEALAGWAI